MKAGIQLGRHFVGYDNTPKVVEQRQMTDLPDKVFVERDGNYGYEYTESEPGAQMIDRFYDILNGEYRTQNYLELFFCLPEVFAPIHEIASRVSDAKWQLKNWWNDEVDEKNQDFIRLFSQPEPLHAMTQFVYNAVCYEILTGKQLWYLNRPDTLPQNTPSSILSWFNLPSHDVLANQKQNVDPYSATEMADFVTNWKHKNGRIFEVEKVLPMLHLDLKKGYDLNCVKNLISGADKAIKNLLPVYEARGSIFVTRGALGFWVSRGKDQNGTVPLTKKERNDLERESDRIYGVTRGRRPYGITNANVDFVRSVMSLQEMQPFDETLADAIAIYKSLRVPRHLVPDKNNSTFANAETDMTSFYQDVIIPWAEKYALMWTEGMGWRNMRKYICPSFDHVRYVQENKKDKAAVDKTNGDIWQQRWQNSVCSLNEWIAAIGGTKGTIPLFDKKLSEMDEEELTIVKGWVNMKMPVTNPNADPNKPTDPNSNENY